MSEDAINYTETPGYQLDRETLLQLVKGDTLTTGKETGIMKTKFLPMNLQLFAEHGEGDQGGTGGNAPADAGGTQGQRSGGDVSFDYDKLAAIINGRQTAAEQTVLKNYFREQGLSKEEADEAMKAYKQQKQEKEPDVPGLQEKLQNAESMLQNSLIEKEGYMIGIELGLEPKSVPYILKMADMQDTIGEDGKVNVDKIKEAINKVLEDIPALKPTESPASGFVKIGADSDRGSGAPDQNTILASIFGNNEK